MVTYGITSWSTISGLLKDKQDQIDSLSEIIKNHGETIEYLHEHIIAITKQQQADWNQTDDTRLNFIKNKPIAATNNVSGFIKGTSEAGMETFGSISTVSGVEQVNNLFFESEDEFKDSKDKEGLHFIIEEDNYYDE